MFEIWGFLIFSKSPSDLLYLKLSIFFFKLTPGFILHNLMNLKVDLQENKLLIEIASFMHLFALDPSPQFGILSKLGQCLKKEQTRPKLST